MPSAGHEPLPEAGARHERTLEAASCAPWFGGGWVWRDASQLTLFLKHFLPPLLPRLRWEQQHLGGFNRRVDFLQLKSCLMTSTRHRLSTATKTAAGYLLFALEFNTAIIAFVRESSACCFGWCCNPQGCAPSIPVRS